MNEKGREKGMRERDWGKGSEREVEFPHIFNPIFKYFDH